MSGPRPYLSSLSLLPTIAIYDSNTTLGLRGSRSVLPRRLAGYGNSIPHIYTEANFVETVYPVDTGCLLLLIQFALFPSAYKVT
jgi:hypothetical protein